MSQDLSFKKLDEKAVLPGYANLGDAGMDLTATSAKSFTDSENGFYYIEYGTGLAVEIPEGFVGLLFPRSSISKTGLILSNSVGVVDSNYRGEIKLRFKVDNGIFSELGDKMAKYNVGDRVAQLMILPFPKMNPKLVDELSSTERGEGGFGSTGK